MSSSVSEDGSLGEIPSGGASGAAPFESLRFARGQVTVTAVKAGGGVFGFALYRAPADFARNQADAKKSQRGISLRVDSLDLPCFTSGAPAVQ